MNPTSQQYQMMINRVARKCTPDTVTLADRKLTEEMARSIGRGIMANTDEAKLNKTEARYWLWLKCQGDLWCGCQCITLKFGHDLRFTPDFWAVSHTGLRAIDVKGFQRDDALVKIRACARIFPWIQFVIAKADGIGWIHTAVKP